MISSSRAASHVHLDVVGGIAGDMFVAAVLDGRPDLVDGTVAAMRVAGVPADWRVEPQRVSDSGLVGTRMLIEPSQQSDGLPRHRRYSEIAASLQAADLEEPVYERALAIMELVAEAEAAVHGVAVADVTLHELGAIDSIADVVGAAYLIETLSPTTWSISPLPVGGGFINTDHGRLPVPAPATQHLLQGFSFLDDGVRGERITPTGAAILRHLEPAAVMPHGIFESAETGHGFGTRALQGLPNLLRMRSYTKHAKLAGDPEVVVIEFMVDDQSPEDLAVGLDVLRELPGVLEVLQSAAVGKKGRLGHSIQVLAGAAALDIVAAACFEQTTTIGLRYRIEKRKVLKRQELDTTAEVGVKVVERPGGNSVKAAMDDIGQRATSHAEREQLRRTIETDALAGDDHGRP